MRQAWTRAAAVAAALATAPAASAHDFWLEAASFRVAEGSTARVDFNIGHGSEVEPWNLRWDKVVGLRSVGPGGATSDQQAAILPPSAAGPKGSAAIELAGPGTHVVAFESHQSLSDLEAARFAEYVEEEGLAAIAADRAARGAAERNGREVYSRRSKLLLQVGPEPTSNALEPVGHTLELVPARNPYALEADEPLDVIVMFRGRPLAGARVDLTALGEDSEPAQVRRSGADGRVSFSFPKEGAYKLNVIWGVPAPGRADAEYDTVFSSLVFGYR
jgi:uncharacterized GH25 family protein